MSPSLGPAPGTRALVVGGCGGIGRSYVDGLIAHDCRVAVLDLGRAFEARPLPPGVTFAAVDVTQTAAFEEAFNVAVAQLGGLDVLAHLVGINPAHAGIADIGTGDLQQVMDVNLYSALAAARLGIDAMRTGGGAMVFVSSGLALNPEPTFGCYAMSKAALIALVKTVGKENAPAIRCNAVAPGLVDTAFLSGGTGSAARRDHLQEMGDLADRIVASIPMGRIARPEEVAAPMLFLSGPGSAHMTGQVLYINGGRLMP